jgi:hypothetical protein
MYDVAMRKGRRGGRSSDGDEANFDLLTSWFELPSRRYGRDSFGVAAVVVVTQSSYYAESNGSDG